MKFTFVLPTIYQDCLSDPIIYILYICIYRGGYSVGVFPSCRVTFRRERNHVQYNECTVSDCREAGLMYLFWRHHCWYVDIQYFRCSTQDSTVYNSGARTNKYEVDHLICIVSTTNNILTVRVKCSLSRYQKSCARTAPILLEAGAHKAFWHMTQERVVSHYTQLHGNKETQNHDGNSYGNS